MVQIAPAGAASANPLIPFTPTATPTTPTPVPAKRIRITVPHQAVDLVIDDLKKITTLQSKVQRSLLLAASPDHLYKVSSPPYTISSAPVVCLSQSPNEMEEHSKQRVYALLEAGQEYSPGMCLAFG